MFHIVFRVAMPAEPEMNTVYPVHEREVIESTPHYPVAGQIRRLVLVAFKAVRTQCDPAELVRDYEAKNRRCYRVSCMECGFDGKRMSHRHSATLVQIIIKQTDGGKAGATFPNAVRAV